MTKIKAVLFDLDGTLVDTAIDMIKALETLAKNHGIEKALPTADYRQYISKGSAALVHALGMDPNRALGISTDNLAVTRMDHLSGPGQGGDWRVVFTNLLP